MNYLDGKNELTLFLYKLKDFVPSIPDPIFPREDKGIVIALEYNPIILWTKCFIIC